MSLVAGSVDGHFIFGKSVPGVTAELGKPSWRRRGTATYSIGYGDPLNFTVMVLFRRQRGILRAWSVALEKPPVYEERLRANLLTLEPQTFAEAAINAYGAALTVARRPHCSKTLCSVTLHVAGSNRNVTFGRTPRLGTFLTLWSSS